LEDICALLASVIFNSIFTLIRANFQGGLFVASGWKIEQTNLQSVFEDRLVLQFEEEMPLI